MSRPQNCLIIFTRYPVPNQTKTRLIPAIGANSAAKLQQVMAQETVAQAKLLQQVYPLTIEIHYSGGNPQLMSDWLGDDLTYKPQTEGDIGNKMSAALKQALNESYRGAIIVGTDCPNLDKEIIEQSLDLLSQNELVIGPTTDGGYYLIGLNKWVPQLFESISWSTSEVCDRTIQIAKGLGLTISYLPQLFDIDRPEDLQLIENNPIYQQIIIR